MSLENSKIFARIAGIPWQKIDEQILILNPEKSEAHEINESAGFIWQELDGHKTYEQVFQNFIDSYEVDSNTAKEDFSETVRKFLDLGLIRSI